jgi:signal transduction histidine kinase
MKDPDEIYRRYKDLQSYVGWSEEDADRIRSMAPRVEPYLPDLIEDFFAEIARHPGARKVFTGGEVQMERQKASLWGWLRELLGGPYDRDYAVRRWRVGMRHVEIGLDQVYTNVALSRLRQGLVRALAETWTGSTAELVATIRSLNRLMDLDLAEIEDAYQEEFTARLQRSERLATLGQVAGGVAHELRNPLNVMRTSLYYLNSARDPSPEKRAEHMRRIERNVARADEVITTLTNFARFPAPDVRPFAVPSCARDAVSDCVVPDGIELAMAFPADLPQAMGDRSQIRIVLGNLIRNAVDAMLPAGGRLTLGGRLDEAAVEVFVADTGVGITPANLVRIMEPLYSTKARGMGLGLALARMIVERNRGTLRVVSEPGKGSTFTVQLPAAASEGDVPL